MVQSLLETLRSKGWSDQDIGRTLDVPRETVFRWRQGTSIQHEAMVLIALKTLLRRRPPAHLKPGRKPAQ